MDHKPSDPDQLVADFAAGLKNGERPSIESVLETWLEQERVALLEQLVAIECQYLSSAGEEIDRDTYLQRFPELSDTLDSLLDTRAPAAADQSTRSFSESEDTATLSWRPSKRGRTTPTIDDSEEYEILDEIARGGMGVVYRARQKQANRTVALKMILAGELAGAEYVERFQKEAEAAAKLDHPGIVPVYDVGQIDGRPYFSMAFVDGQSLSQAIREQPLAPSRSAELLSEVASAVQFAHERQIIHRDLKPGNILLDADGAARITDFGLAKQMEADSQLTTTGQILGTPSYMPPEQARGNLADVDVRSDVYSLGAILYATLTGRPPHQAATPTETLRAVLEREPAPPRQLNPSVPRDLETICLKALAKSPARRYASAADFRDDLQRFLSSEPIRARRVGLIEKSRLWTQRNPQIVAAFVVLLLLSAAGVAAAYEWRMRSAADVLVNGLAEADPQGVLAISEQLQQYGDRADRRLRELAMSEPADAAGRRRRLHARMAIVGQDRQQTQPLTDELLDAGLPYVEPITQALTPYREQIASSLWPVLEDNEASVSQRFRAGLALGQLVPADPRWTEEHATSLLRSYLDTNPEFHPIARRCLKGVRGLLKPHILAAYRDRDQPKIHLNAAAILVRDYYADDDEALVPLLLRATADQFLTLFPLIRERRQFDAALLAKVAEAPTSETGTAERITLGVERAGAAIALLRKGYRDELLAALQVDDDPEALTQFVDRCREREVTLDELHECWRLLPTPAERQELPVSERRMYDSQHYGLLLAMGEYPLAATGSSQDKLVAQLLTLFENDPSSGVHAAAGWLLRKWGREDPQLMQSATRLDQRVVPPSDEREWFTIRVDVPAADEATEPQVFFQTYVVFDTGEYRFGSPDDELRQGDEVRHTRQVSRFAILEREIARGEYEVSGHRIEQVEQFSASLAHVSLGFNWYDAVRYCRWLNTQTEFFGQQPYPAPDSVDREKYPPDPRDDLGPAPKNWPLDLTQQGFRLPTEHEWEAMSRAGMRTAFSFGGDYDRLGGYGWYQDSSGKIGHPPRMLRPNLRGIFDAHGNGYEWIHDWEGGYPNVDSPSGPPQGDVRMTRGGSWFLTAPYCRSSFRYGYPPSNRNVDFAIRTARTMPPRGGQ